MLNNRTSFITGVGAVAVALTAFYSLEWALVAAVTILVTLFFVTIETST